jgi:predicted O-methyltransferase YrrM
MSECSQNNPVQQQTIAPEHFDAAPEVAGTPVSNGHRAEPLLHRFLRKIKTNDRCFSAMVSAFKTLQRLGISLGPNHFYWPVPNVSELERQRWPAGRLDAPIDLHFSAQLDFLHEMAAEYASEWNFPERPISDSGYHYNNGFFESVDAEIAYSVVRRFKPSRIIEVGGGYSTRLLTEALRTNFEQDGVRAELTTIDPCLNASRDPAATVSTEVIPRPVQEIDLDLFLSLEERDVLFLDSSHVARVGSDVVYEYLEILPRLRKGVLIHAHDIFLPHDYPLPWVVQNLSFWNEQYLLLAFLAFNSAFEILWSSSGMQLFHPRTLEKMIPHWRHSHRKLPKGFRRFVPSLDGERIWPSSFWMRRAA